MALMLCFGLALMCFMELVFSARKKNGLFGFSSLVAVVILGWFIPQQFGLIVSDGAPEGAAEKLGVMAVLCFLAVHYGSSVKVSPFRSFCWELSAERLLHGALVLSVLGSFFFYQVGVLAAEVTEEYGGAWTGVITIYYFLSQMLSVGLAISLVVYLTTRAPSALFLSFVGVAFYLHRIVVFGRRAAMVELLLMLLYAFWFCLRKSPPRIVVILFFAVGVLMVNSIGDYRTTMLGDDRASWSGATFKDIAEIDFIGNIRQMFSGQIDASEVRHAAIAIEAADRFSYFDFGASLWNEMIFQFVPGQLFGADFKRSLQFELPDSAYEVFGHRVTGGATVTGLVDAFRSYWYFGAFKYLLIAFLINKADASARNGKVFYLLFLMVVMTQALHSFTHTTHRFFLASVQFLVFMMPVMLWARVSIHKAQ